MSKYSLEKGFRDGEKGNPPDLMPEKKQVSDYIFATTSTKEERKESNDDYLKGYGLATAQKSTDSKEKK